MAGLFVDTWHGELLTKENSVDEMTEQPYWDLLSADEKTKAQSYSRFELQKKYIKTRGVLREILASYLKIPAPEIAIQIAEHGKPYLSNYPLYFNLTHTGNEFAVAVSNISEIGIDLEVCRQRKSQSAMVEKCFSSTEQHYWNSLPEDQKALIFYQFWVRKEAFVKAVGRGIALGLNQCEINPDKQNEFLSIPEGYGKASDWKILEVVLGNNDCCALVTQDRDFQYKQFFLQ